MDDEGGPEQTGGADRPPLERAVLADTEAGRAIAAGFVGVFGEFVSGSVRPVLRDVAAAGGEPQLLVNGLAQLMREVAASIEMTVEEARRRPPSPEPLPEA